jgi:hypothetical protein
MQYRNFFLACKPTQDAFSGGQLFYLFHVTGKRDLETMKESNKISVKVTGLWPEIQTLDLPNKKCNF